MRLKSGAFATVSGLASKGHIAAAADIGGGVPCATVAVVEAAEWTRHHSASTNSLFASDSSTR